MSKIKQNLATKKPKKNASPKKSTPKVKPSAKAKDSPKKSSKKAATPKKVAAKKPKDVSKPTSSKSGTASPKSPPKKKEAASPKKESSPKPKSVADAKDNKASVSSRSVERDLSVELPSADQVFIPGDKSHKAEIDKLLKANVLLGQKIEVFASPWLTGWSKCRVLSYDGNKVTLSIDKEGNTNRKDQALDLHAHRWKMNQSVECWVKQVGQEKRSKVTGDIVVKSPNADIDYQGTRRRFLRIRKNELQAIYRPSYQIPEEEKNELTRIRNERSLKVEQIRKENEEIITKAQTEHDDLLSKVAAEEVGALAGLEKEYDIAQEKTRAEEWKLQDRVEELNAGAGGRASIRQASRKLAEAVENARIKILVPAKRRLDEASAYFDNEKKKIDRDLKNVLKNCEGRLDHFLESNEQQGRRLEQRWNIAQEEDDQKCLDALNERLESDWVHLKFEILRNHGGDEKLMKKMLCTRCVGEVAVTDGLCAWCQEFMRKEKTIEELGLKPSWCKAPRLTGFAVFYNAESKRMRCERPDIDGAVMNHMIKQRWQDELSEDERGSYEIQRTAILHEMLEHLDEKHESDDENFGSTENICRDLHGKSPDSDEEQTDWACVKCKSSKQDDLLILCENHEICNVQRHTFCCEPKLSVVPDGAWYCSVVCERLVTLSNKQAHFTQQIANHRQALLANRDGDDTCGVGTLVSCGSGDGNLSDDVRLASMRRSDFMLQRWDKVAPFLADPEAKRQQLEDQIVRQEMPPRRTHDFSKTPECVNGTMRPYQLEGLSWLVANHEAGANSIMGDEMGLGKTLQTISFLAYLSHNVNFGPFLVVCPLSVLPSWQTELKKWAPALSYTTFYGGSAEREAQKKNILSDSAAGNSFLLLTTYECLVNELSWFVNKFYFRYVVLDEAQRIKNEESLIGKAVREVRSAYRLLLTGTPLQNNLGELWALLNFMYPEVFTADMKETFNQGFVLPSGQTATFKDQEKLKYAHDLLKPMMLRRLKSDVLTSILPPKREVIVRCEMSPVQRWHYRNLLSSYAGTQTARDLTAAKKNGVKYRSLNALLMQLWKCCLHPFLFDGVQETKPDIMTGKMIKVIDETVVYSSGKLAILDHLVKQLLQVGSKVLIFSQFTSMLTILEDFCRLRDYKFIRLDGGTSFAKRKMGMKRFNSDDPTAPKIYLISTKAGGLGINLQTADTVILFDSSWNPFVDLQAQDRAHRMGQKKPVTVYRLLSQDTCEERIRYFAEQKMLMKESVLRESIDDDKVLEAKQEDALAADAMAKVYTDNEVNDIVRFGADSMQGDGQEVDGRDFYDMCGAKFQHQLANLAKSEQVSENKIDTKKFGDVSYKKGNQSKSSIQMLAEMIQYQESQGLSVKRERVSNSVEIDTGEYGVGKIKVSRWSLENQEKQEAQDRVERNRREAQRLVAKRVLEHEHECAHCKEHVLKATVRISTEVDTTGKLVKKRRLEGSHQTCPNCPIAMHTTCRQLPMYQQHQGCPQHRCKLCCKGASDSGGLLLRCVDCLNAFCYLCMEDKEMVDLVEFLEDHPTWTRCKGYVAPKTVEYMRCPDCVSQPRNLEAIAAFRKEAQAYQPQIEDVDTSVGSTLESSPGCSP